ncbi:MAG: peptidoglycan DD-metalloendopeptidase family protein [Elusimicrobia bacterium]|nr:peptidoglycan DD-metalloendopeptidase family protein [Elusimicrobiota bacterium]
MVPGLLYTAAALTAWAQVAGPSIDVDVPAIGQVREVAGPRVQPAVPAPPKPEIRPRSDWDPKPPRAPDIDPEPRARIVVHHTARPLPLEALERPGDPSLDDARAVLREELRVHVRQMGWADIAYHYLVDWEGRVWAGRPVASVGAHTEGRNRGSIGVAVLGNWERRPRSAAELDARAKQLEGLEALLTWLSWAHQVKPQSILGHHEYNATACPGAFLARSVQSDEAAQRRGQPPSPLRAIRLRILARYGAPNDAKHASRTLAERRAGPVGRGLAALTAPVPESISRIFDNVKTRPNSEFVVPADPNLARAKGPEDTLPSLPAPVAPMTRTPALPAIDPAVVDDGRFQVPFATQEWPAVRRGGNWGASRSYGRHSGIDFVAGEGTPVFAARPGRVSFVDTRYTRSYMRTSAGRKGYGNRVVIEHPDGTETEYAHLAPGSVQVRVGDVVTRDTQIAAVGSTGHSTGPHLHFMVVSADGDPQNPAVALGRQPPPKARPQYARVPAKARPVSSGR